MLGLGFGSRLRLWVGARLGLQLQSGLQLGARAKVEVHQSRQWPCTPFSRLRATHSWELVRISTALTFTLILKAWNEEGTNALEMALTTPHSAGGAGLVSDTEVGGPHGIVCHRVHDGLPAPHVQGHTRLCHRDC